MMTRENVSAETGPVSQNITTAQAAMNPAREEDRSLPRDDEFSAIPNQIRFQTIGRLDASHR
jgi:hypothetical protein